MCIHSKNIHSGSAQAAQRLCTASHCASPVAVHSQPVTVHSLHSQPSRNKASFVLEFKRKKLGIKPDMHRIFFSYTYKCVSIAKIFTAAVHRQPSGCAQPARWLCTASPVAVHSQPVAVHSQPSGCAQPAAVQGGCAQPAQWLCILRKYFSYIHSSAVHIATAIINTWPSGRKKHRNPHMFDPWSTKRGQLCAGFDVTRSSKFKVHVEIRSSRSL